MEKIKFTLEFDFVEQKYNARFIGEVLHDLGTRMNEIHNNQFYSSQDGLSGNIKVTRNRDGSFTIKEVK